MKSYEKRKYSSCLLLLPTSGGKNQKTGSGVCRRKLIYSRFTFIEAVVVHVSVHVDVFSSGQGQFHLGVVVRAVIGIVAGDN